LSTNQQNDVTILGRGVEARTGNSPQNQEGELIQGKGPLCK